MVPMIGSPRQRVSLDWNRRFGRGDGRAGRDNHLVNQSAKSRYLRSGEESPHSPGRFYRLIA